MTTLPADSQVIPTVPSDHGAGAMALEVEQVSKAYSVAIGPVVKQVSFAVAPGEVVGLLGPNGAGKSTTIGMITTRVPIDSGDIRVGNSSVREDPATARAAIGVTGQSNTLDGQCTISENLYLHCRYHGMARVAARRRAARLIEEFRLEGKANVKPDALSGGLSRRVQLARAMAHEPPLLLLDEPTNELDVPSRAFFWSQIDGLRRRGATAVLFATHLLEEAEEHCDRVLIIDAGKIVLEGEPAALRRQFKGQRTLEMTASRPLDPLVQRSVAALPGVVRCSAEGRRLTALLDSGRVALDDLARATDGAEVEDIAIRNASLREIFLEVVSTEEW